MTRLLIFVEDMIGGTHMENAAISKQLKQLHTLAMVNAGIWALSLIALVVLLEGSGNLRGLYVILATGVAVSIQLISLVSKVK